MRYIGYVAQYSTLYHVKDICINEMIARVLKRLLNSEISNSIKETRPENLSVEENSTFSRHQPIKKGSHGILKTNASASNLKTGVHFRNMERSVGFADENDANNSHDRVHLDHLDVDGAYGAQFIDHDKCEEWYMDFLNLVFGNTKETHDFFKDCVYPIVEDYYSYPLERLLDHKITHNALYYALTYHAGIRVQNEDELFERLGSWEKPFRNENSIIPYIRYKVYSMRSLRINDFANKYKEYRVHGQNETALNACRSKIHYIDLLEGTHDIDAQGEIAELLLEEGLYEEAIDEARKGLDIIGTNDCSAIKFYCVLMRAYQHLNDLSNSQIYFNEAIRCLEHNWGPEHPLHTTIYRIMAFLMIECNKFKEAEILYKASLSCCSKVLGPNHIQTAEVYMDFGRLYLRMSYKNESLTNFQAAYYIYLSYFGKNSIPVANAAFQISKIMEENGRLEQGLEYAVIAYDGYSKLNGQISDYAILSLWIVITISYSLKNSKTAEYWNLMYETLIEREEYDTDAVLEGRNDMGKHIYKYCI